MSREWNEDTRVKFPSIIQFMRLGYEYLSLKNVDIDKNTNILKDVFKESISRINNKTYSDKEIDNIILDIDEKISLKDKGETFYSWLIKPNPEQVKLVDFDNISNNSFNIVTEMYYTDNPNGSFRPDISVIINGIPLSFLEVKKKNNSETIQAEFNRMKTRMNNQKYRKYFNLFQYTTYSNNMEYMEQDEGEEFDLFRAGSFYATPNDKSTVFSPFREEDKEYHQNMITKLKVIDDEKIKYILRDNKFNPNISETKEFKSNIDDYTPCNKFIMSFFNIERFMFLLQYGILYVNTKESFDKQKVCMRYPQFYAVKGILNLIENQSKNQDLMKIMSGICWMSAGVGKTNLASFTTPVLYDYYKNKGKKLEVFFVVDRLDLLTQSSNDFVANNMEVTKFKSVKSFTKYLQGKEREISVKNGSIGSISVVNIHKFSKEDLDFSYKSSYNEDVQRIFFVDEAHRSYGADNGEFYTNLMKIGGNDSIYIALTATPILNTDSTKSTKNKFGEYIYKYFFDKSVNDGYTLKIFREQIKVSLVNDEDKKSNLYKERLEALHKEPYFIDNVGEYIAKDLMDFRVANEDKTLGGMVVCSSLDQVYLIEKWFKNNTNLRVGVVTSKESTKDNVAIQTKFKDYKFNKDKKGKIILEDYDYEWENNLDLIIVYNMLITGFSANRLKKLYLLRTTFDHTLIQTISRVNRPYYHYKTGKRYNYGYLVDFADIHKEFDRVMENYLTELDSLYKENIENLGLYIDTKKIFSQLQKNIELLSTDFDLENKEEFSKEITKLRDVDKLKSIQKKLAKIHEDINSLEIAKYDTNTLSADHFKDLRIEATNRINFLTFKEKSEREILGDFEDSQLLLHIEKTRDEIVKFSKLDPEQNNMLVEILNYDYKIKETLINDIFVKVNYLVDKENIALYRELALEYFTKYNTDSIYEYKYKLAIDVLNEIKQDYENVLSIEEQIDSDLQKESIDVTEFGHKGFYEIYQELIYDENLTKYDSEYLKEVIMCFVEVYNNYKNTVIADSEINLSTSIKKLLVNYVKSKPNLRINYSHDKDLYDTIISKVFKINKRLDIF